MTNFFNFLNTHTWAALIFVILCITISICGLVGSMVLCYDITIFIENKQIKKLEKKYPELFVKIKEYDKIQKSWGIYYSKYIQPIQTKIDTLVQDNYIQVEEKNKQLYILREEYAQNNRECKLICDKRNELRKEIDNKVKTIYQTDKKIKKVWGINQD